MKTKLKSSIAALVKPRAKNEAKLVKAMIPQPVHNQCEYVQKMREQEAVEGEEVGKFASQNQLRKANRNY